MDLKLAEAFAEPPLSELDEEVRSFASTALSELDPGSSLDDVFDVLGPFLLDAAQASDEADARRICASLCLRAGISGDAQAKSSPKASFPLAFVPAERAGLRLKGSLADAISSEDAIAENDAGSSEAQRKEGLRQKPSSRSAAALKAAAAQAAEAASAPGAVLELQSGATEITVARLLRAEQPTLGEKGEKGDTEPEAPYLAASFFAYAEGRSSGRFQHWCDLLAEVLSDACVQLDEDNPSEAIARVVKAMIRSGALALKERILDVGEQVLALLVEDDEWHPAIVDEVLDQDLRVIFMEYGKPQLVNASQVRTLEDVVDEDAGEGAEGDCEICRRRLFLTFHHLIPKDTHSRYLGKRLPPGIVGEPTRHFLNSHGTMICRQCHNTVHRSASNDVLAAEYNTLEKLLAHPSLQRWMEW
eukprot:CAMPEP_0170583338 /NCGR_PEP_ID=MMETSP0224-20130122/8077_1 /TAXON_ID=285029 /ORGANISM="Togula jolla, Strain CCCM 725" /LENGTH=416 /DNA_ID=CAMNT_0010906649 /DNA_START=50 /DNA_END=1297 /DNA_ORIENTATION=+